MSDIRRFLSDFWRLTWPYWRSGEWKFAWVMFIILIGFTYADIQISVWYNMWGSAFMKSMQQYDYPAFKAVMWEFSLLAFTGITVGVVSNYFQQWLEIRWRRWLFTNYLKEWMSGNSYYNWHLTGKATDNPDQRLTEDIRDFTNRTLTLFFSLLASIGILYEFTKILWRVSGPLNIGGDPYNVNFPVPLTGATLDLPPLIVGGFDIPAYMFWICLIYAIGGTWLGHLIGKRLIPLFFDQQKYEANLRFGLARLRETSEQVALSRGEKVEEVRLLSYFDNVYANFWRLMNAIKWVITFRLSYTQLAIIFPYIVASPRYFSKQIDLGDLRQISHAFEQVRSSLSWFITNYQEVANWRSIVIRLNGFLDVVEATKHVETGATFAQQDKDAPLTVQGLTLNVPNGTKLFGPVDVEVKPGMSVLVSGPSGTGKSTLFRALVGLWPFAKGRISVPNGARMMVVPQKPYMPMDALRAAVCYPSENSAFTNEEILAAMAQARISQLADRLLLSENWAMVLSPGEQQRVAFARIFLHKPDWLFLDESTSALDEETQKLMYEELRKAIPGITIVSIAHRASLRNYHDFIIDVSAPEPKLETLKPA